MKALCSVFVVFLFASCATAQALSDSSTKPYVTVLQKKWRMEVHNAKLDEDQFEVQKERDQEERARKDREIQNDKLREQGMATKLPPASQPATKARGLSVIYIYEVKIRNSGEKDVRTLTWDYVFFDPVTKQEVGRQQFVSAVRIGTGKSKNVVAHSSSSPTGTIDAAKVDKKSQDLYSEQVIIQSIGYADGSVWKAASN